MKTSDVKVNEQYLYNDKIVTVLARIKGRPKRNSGGINHGGMGWYELHYTRKKFILCNGEEVYSNVLSSIINNK